MSPPASLPDEAWCRDLQGPLGTDPSTRAALDKIGKPVFLKLKEDAGDRFVIVRLGLEGTAGTAGDGIRLSLHGTDTVEEDGLIVSMTLDTWRRLLSGSLDLATGLMGRDVKAKGSMFELLRIADPAEKIIQAFRRAQEEAP